MKRDVGGNSSPLCIFQRDAAHIFSLAVFVFHFSPSLPVCGVLESLALCASNTTPDLGPGQYQEWPPELLHLIMIVNIDGQELKGC